MRRRPEPGTRVRFTGVFLRSTGQIVGGEGLSRWTVTPCTCATCARDGSRIVAVDEPSCCDPTRARHMAYANLERCR